MTKRQFFKALLAARRELEDNNTDKATGMFEDARAMRELSLEAFGSTRTMGLLVAREWDEFFALWEQLSIVEQNENEVRKDYLTGKASRSAYDSALALTLSAITDMRAACGEEEDDYQGDWESSRDEWGA